MSSRVSGYGGSAKLVALDLKASLRNRKNTFMQKQQQMPPMMPPQPMGPPMGQASDGCASTSDEFWTEAAALPMGAMRPMPMQGSSYAWDLAPIAGPGRMIGGNASVGSAPVQMMSGGVVPIFRWFG